MEEGTPYLSTPPSSPKKHFGKHFFSAPTSPRRISEFYSNFDDDVFLTNRSVAVVPFEREEKPGKPKSSKPTNACEDDFAFDVGEEMEKSRILRPAEELFDCGKIRPLNPPPQIKTRGENEECQIRKRFLISDIRDAFSTRKKIEFDPFGEKVPNTEKRSENERGRERVSSFSPRKKKEFDPFGKQVPKAEKRSENERGREKERVSSFPSSSNSVRRGARSVSPYRVSKYPWEEEEKAENTNEITAKMQNSLPSSSSKNKRKWRLKDFFLFRSASEGRSVNRDPQRKYTHFFSRRENVKYSRLRSVEGSDSGSTVRKAGRVSAHELHYTANRAASEDLKKKTFLPYKQGILGRLAFNPAVHALANGFGFSTK